jgi:DNA (cytosine-5)-methyltransferase 1
MRVGSLFSGIGGLDLAIEAHGYEVAWQIENDDYCNKILAKHWPEVTRYGDIRAAQFNEFERVDGIVGGFPCQPFSVAGRNRGEDDERNMWPEVIRAIRALQPGFAFLENVPNLLNHLYFGRILGDLAEAGYDAEWGTFRASDVGAPHRRERLFILAYAQHDGHCVSGPEINPGEARVDALSDVAAHGRDDVADTKGSGITPQANQWGTPFPDNRPPVWDRPDADGRADVGYTSSSGLSTGGHPEPGRFPNAIRTPAEESEHRDNRFNRSGAGNSVMADTEYSGVQFPPHPNDLDGWTHLLSEMPEAVEPSICRDADGVSDRLDNRAKRLKALGNAVVWPQAALAFQELNRRIINGGETEHDNYNTNGRRPRAGTVKVPGAV